MNLLREPRRDEVALVVPFTPPSVNHYKKPIKGGRGYYVTKAALKFKEAVALLSKGSVDAHSYKVCVTIYLGKGKRGDAGNFEKCIGDGLEDAGIITNDSKIRHYDIKVDRDWKNPRTEILVTPLETKASQDLTEINQELNNLDWQPPLAIKPKVEVRRKLCALHGAAVCRQCQAI